MTRLPPQLNGEASGVLLVVSNAEEIAKRIESHLRNAGHPLQAAWINDLEDLEDVLRRNPPDLILCDEAVRAAPSAEVIKMSGELCPDLPVIALTGRHSVDNAAVALAAGFADFVSYDDVRHLRHLELVVIREFVKHHHLRNLRLTQEKAA